MGKYIQEFRRQLDIIRKLPLRKKPEHIWRYYRVHILVILAVIITLVSFVRLAIYNQREVLISGFFLNTATSDEGFACLTDSYWAYCGADPHQRVELVRDRFLHFDEDSVFSQDDSATLVMLSVMLGDKGIDYIITNEAALQYLTAQGVVMDLRTLLPEERLSQLETVESAAGVVGIRLGNPAFARKYPFLTEDTCIFIPSTIPSQERVLRFLDYLLADW